MYLTCGTSHLDLSFFTHPILTSLSLSLSTRGAKANRWLLVAAAPPRKGERESYGVLGDYRCRGLVWCCGQWRRHAVTNRHRRELLGA